jgi:hypothetical protein
MGIDPKLQTCTCGHQFHPTLLMKILMLVRGTYDYRCPRCQALLKFRFIGHVVKVETMEVKNRSEVWKNG